MNRIVNIVIFIALLAGFAGCSEETMVEFPDPSVPEGYIRATLDLQVEGNDSIHTRATDTEEEAYDDSNVWVLLFNADTDQSPTTLLQAPVKATKSENKLYVLLRATAQPVTLYIVAGLSADLNTVMGTATNFTAGVTDFADVNNLLQTAAVTAAGVPVGEDVPVVGTTSYCHMSSGPVYKGSGTISITTSIAQGLTRNVAKINVDASAVSAEFTLEGVTLVNGAKQGYVFRQADIPASSGTDVQQYSEKTPVSGNELTSQIYLYENAGLLSDGTTPNPTMLIIRGTYKGVSGYYRMDILKKNTDGTYTPYDIERNYCYTLTITNIENGGYLTPKEAIDAEPSNTWYRVDVTDDVKSHDVVTNGHYYLGVSNSEFFVYGNDDKVQDQLITTVSTNAPAGTYTLITPSDANINLITSSLTTPTGVRTETEIHADLSGVGASYTGHIDLRVGNLTRRITIQRKMGVVYGLGEITDFSVQDYVTGRVATGKEWVRLTTESGADFSLCPASLINPQGGLYVRYNSTNVTQSAELYVSKADNRGRAKMLLFINSNE